MWSWHGWNLLLPSPEYEVQGVTLKASDLCHLVYEVTPPRNPYTFFWSAMNIMFWASALSTVPRIISAAPQRIERERGKQACHKTLHFSHHRYNALLDQSFRLLVFARDHILSGPHHIFGPGYLQVISVIRRKQLNLACKATRESPQFYGTRLKCPGALNGRYGRFPQGLVEATRMAVYASGQEYMKTTLIQRWRDYWSRLLSLKTKSIRLQG
ncbi:hypothetical protein BKA82DRAFT_3242971 [Pisolithus tinctorius]|nr:hypothetical protein BKA82DRAFT_3242971 [Pisolithus tinctorius]